MSIMRKCVDPSATPVVGAMCIVLTEDDEVPLRTAYWCNGVWRDPHTARRLVPLVLSWCLMREAVFMLSLPRCREAAERIRCPKCGWKAGEA